MRGCSPRLRRELEFSTDSLASESGDGVGAAHGGGSLRGSSGCLGGTARLVASLRTYIGG